MLLSEFDRLRNSGVRFDSRLLRKTALDLIDTSTNPECNSGTSDPKSGLLIKENIKSMWISWFMHCNNIVTWTQTGKLFVVSSGAGDN